jgi:hypothetical protein
MSNSSVLGWCACKVGNRQLPAHAIDDKFEESRMSGNLLVRFDEGRLGRTSVLPSLLLYRRKFSCPASELPIFSRVFSTWSTRLPPGKPSAQPRSDIPLRKRLERVPRRRRGSRP